LHPFEYANLSDCIETSKTEKRTTFLALDHVQDPQNFGALCRSAEALGCSAIIVPKDRSALVTSAVYHASVGAVDTIPVVQVVNLSQALRELKEAEYWIIGSQLGNVAKPPWKMPDFEKNVLVLGAEGDGISALTQKNCDWLLEIPLTGKVQSMNVSAAGACLLYEFFRRRHLTDQTVDKG
jgi:23S rRNA (guanosine2251-2'-O)-methyltransferase